MLMVGGVALYGICDVKGELVIPVQKHPAHVDI